MRTTIAFFSLLFYGCAQNMEPTAKAGLQPGCLRSAMGTSASRIARAMDTLDPFVPEYDSKRLYKSQSITGDFDQDTIPDRATLMVPMDPADEWEMFNCRPCNTKIIFSNYLAPVYTEGDIGGRLENVGDLDHDGIDEIAYSNEWFISCWHSLCIYTFKNNRWKRFATARINACLNRSHKKRISRINDSTLCVLDDDPNETEPTRNYITFWVMH